MKKVPNSILVTGGLEHQGEERVYKKPVVEWGSIIKFIKGWM